MLKLADGLVSFNVCAEKKWGSIIKNARGQTLMDAFVGFDLVLSNVGDTNTFRTQLLIHSLGAKQNYIVSNPTNVFVIYPKKNNKTHK